MGIPDSAPSRGLQAMCSTTPYCGSCHSGRSCFAAGRRLRRHLLQSGRPPTQSMKPPARLFSSSGEERANVRKRSAGNGSRYETVSRATRVLANSLGSCRWQGRHVRGVARIEVSVRSRRPLRHCHALCAYATAVQPGSGVEQKSWVPRLGTSGGQGRGRTGDLSLFRRTLLPTELPGRWVACSSPSDPDGTRTRDLRRDRAAR